MHQTLILKSYNNYFFLLSLPISFLKILLFNSLNMYHQMRSIHILNERGSMTLLKHHFGHNRIKLTHPFPRIGNQRRNIFGQLIEFQSIVLHTNIFLANVNELKYFYLYHLKGNKPSNESNFKLLQSRRSISTTLASFHWSTIL